MVKSLAVVLRFLLPIRHLHAQAFPIFAVDTAVKNRLAEEWEPSNRFQNERGYCVTYSVFSTITEQGPVTVYTLTGVSRAVEEGASPSGIMKATCPLAPNVAFLHTHPPVQCDYGECVVGGPWSNQCYPSPTDMYSLNRSDKPFTVIQCDRYALVPVWRTLPYQLKFGILIGAHR